MTRSVRMLVWVGVSVLLVLAANQVLESQVQTARPPQARSSVSNPLVVSLIQLIARPDDFDGEFVQVFGFYRHEFEGNSIYLHREDFEHGLRKNGLWMEGNAAFNMSYVLVEGRFSAKRHGHLELWSGAIEQVTRMVPWPPKPVTNAPRR